MALLQISEPGQTAAPHQSKRAIGIDLGTTHSLVATVRSGQAVVLTDHQGDALCPSVVHYGEQTILVGRVAEQCAAQDPENTISSVKRLLGRSLADVRVRYPHLPNQLQASDHGLPLIVTRQGAVNPIAVSSQILAHLNQLATEALAGEPQGVVITVPAYFDDAQRAATKDAAALVGLNVLRLLNEPTAAALAYGLDGGQEGVIAVYDLGGGTFDISVLRLERGVFEVLATGGDSALGGDDFDALIRDWIVAESGIEVETAQQQQALNSVAKVAKEALSDQDKTQIEVLGWQGELSRAQFDALVAPLIQRTLLACRRALKDAKVSPAQVQEVVMVGGSTRVPAVRQAVTDFFARPLLTAIDPDQVVAIGAALQAHVLVGNKPDHEMLLLDVIPLSLGIETMGGLVEKIIPRNTTIPVARAQEFTTFKDGQTAMRIHVVQGERDMVDDCRSLAHFTLQGIPPMTAGAAHVRVTYQVDADGLLSVTAMEKGTKVQAAIEVKPAYGLSDDEIAEMLQSSMAHAAEDMQARALSEQRVEAARVLEGIESALRADGERLLSPQSLKHIGDLMQALAKTSQREDARAIEQAIQQLDQATQDFAARRMDDSIRRALAGHSIDEV